MTAENLQTSSHTPELSQVRELLFGEQMRAMTAELSSRDAAARDAWQRDNAELRDHLDTVAEQIGARLADANEAIATLQSQLREGIAALEVLVAHTQQAQTEMLEEAKKVIDERIESVDSRLDAQKVSRRSMAELLSSMALQIADGDETAGQGISSRKDKRGKSVAAPA